MRKLNVALSELIKKLTQNGQRSVKSVQTNLQIKQMVCSLIQGKLYKRHNTKTCYIRDLRSSASAILYLPFNNSFFPKKIIYLTEWIPLRMKRVRKQIYIIVIFFPTYCWLLDANYILQRGEHIPHVQLLSYFMILTGSCYYFRALWGEADPKKKYVHYRAERILKQKKIIISTNPSHDPTSHNCLSNTENRLGIQAT